MLQEVLIGKDIIINENLVVDSSNFYKDYKILDIKKLLYVIISHHGLMVYIVMYY